jgi:predicted deacylase
MGEKGFGSLKLAEDPLQDITIPVGIVRGARDGPVVCVLAGTHACEYVGIDTAVKLYHDAQPSKLRGTLLILPAINPFAFKTITPYVNPIDGLNMAFMFTGSINGTTTERMAEVILESAVFQADFVLDLHGGDLNEIMLPSVIAAQTGNKEVDDKSMAMARAFGTEYVIVHKSDDTPSTAAKYNYESTIESRAAKKGIPGIVGEIGSDGRSSPAEVGFYLERVQNVLRYLGMLDGPLNLPRRQSAISGSVRIRANKGGIFSPAVKVGDLIKKGATVGRITDLKGDILEDLSVPQDSLVTLFFTKHVVYPGQIVVSLSTKVESLPSFTV